MSKLKKSQKIYYGLGDLSYNIMFAAISFFFLYFLINVAGVSPLWAAFIFPIAKLWDAVTDYFMGVISDRTKSKYGKRRVYMLFGALPFGLVFILMWLVPFNDNSSQLIKFIYYTFIYMIFNTTFTIVYVPYNALTANMTNDYDERTSLNGYRIALANVGLLLGAAVFALLADGTQSVFYKLLGSQKEAYLLASVIFGVLSFVIMFICAYKVKENKEEEIKENPYGFFETIKQLFKLKEFRNTSLYYLFSMVGFDIIMAIIIFYVNDVLKFKGGDESMIYIALALVIAIATAAIWVKLSEKFSKIGVYFSAVVFISIVLIGSIFIPEQNALLLTCLCVGIGIGMSAIQILPFSSVPDIVEVDEMTYKVRREGAYYGIVQFFYKLASGFAVTLVSIILYFAGYKENALSQPDQALLSIRLMLGILPGIFFLISAIFGMRANMGRKRFNEIKKNIQENKNE